MEDRGVGNLYSSEMTQSANHRNGTRERHLIRMDPIKDIPYHKEASRMIPGCIREPGELERSSTTGTTRYLQPSYQEEA